MVDMFLIIILFSQLKTIAFEKPCHLKYFATTCVFKTSCPCAFAW